MAEGLSEGLSVLGLVAGYDPGVPIVNGASLAARPGEIIAVIGPNGAGKSTLVKAVAGQVPVAAGAIRLDGRDLTRVAPHDRVRCGLAFVPQTENVFARMSVESNLRLACHVLPHDKRAGAVTQALEAFPDLLRQRRLAAGRLSGGQRQMLAIARAVAVNPKALILDEPSAGLSPKLVGEVFAALSRLRAQGLAIVLVEQNARAALALADRAYVLVEGRNRHEGSAADLQRDPAIGRLYLGSPEALPA